MLRFKSIYRVLPLCALMLCSGCTMAPNYERPDLPVPQNFTEYPEFNGVGGDTPTPTNTPQQDEQIEPAEDERPSKMIGWREFFVDPTLQQLIEAALENNRDMRIAVLNVEKARAAYNIQRADLLPTINASGANSNQLIPAEFAAPSPTSVISRSTSVSVGFTSFELDLFGRVRSLRSAALERYFAQQHNTYTAQISLVAEIAAAYLQLVSTKELYALAEETYNTRIEALKLMQAKYDSGIASQLSLNQAKTAVQEARVTAVTAKTSTLKFENALAFLIGGPLPQDINIPSHLADVQKVSDLPAGLPSYMLERRPDILAAEHTLKAYNANIGAARANFFPRIGLTGSLGTMSADVDNLFTGAAKTWAFAPQATLPIFDTGRNIANLKVANVEKDIAIATYEKAIQNGFREVADALAQRSTIQEQLNASKGLLEATKESYDIANLRYDVGLDSFINVLDAQRAYFGAQQSHVNSVLLREVNSINLYKSLGGGWE